MICLVHGITGKGYMEEVTFEIILKRSHVWTGKDGINMELILQAKAKNRKVGSIFGSILDWPKQCFSNLLCM